MEKWNMDAINWLQTYEPILSIILLITIALLIALLCSQAQSIIERLSNIENRLNFIDKEISKLDDIEKAIIRHS